MAIEVQLTQAQWTLAMRIVDEEVLGASPAEVLRKTLVEHHAYVQGGGSPYGVGGRNVIDVERPEYGPVRFQARVEAATGKAVQVRRGEVLRISQVAGGQCVDFNAYNLDDYKEYLDCGMNRLRGVHTGEGTIVWTGSPRARPMFAILKMPETCDQYYGGHRCNGLMYEMEWNLPDHPNCQDNFAEAIREYGLTPDDVHDSYNFWMSATLDAEGRRIFPWNRGTSDDYVDLVAFFDTLAVPVACAGDLASVNSFRPSPVDVAVFEPSAQTVALIEQVNQEMTGFKAQKTTADYSSVAIQSSRGLTRDPSYEPRFNSLGPGSSVVMDLNAGEQLICEELMETGIYGATVDLCIVASFCRWFEVNRVPKRHSSLRFLPSVS